MNYCIYNLPRNYNNITEKDIKIQYNKKINPYINTSLFFYLQKAKKNIDLYDNDWDVYKKITNPLEFLHTQCKNICISQYTPLSRAYYKFIEIYKQTELKFSDSIQSFHLAEGPGGFLEAMTHLRKYNTNDIYYGMTLIKDNNKNIPSWNKSLKLIQSCPKIRIEYGVDGTGDLYSYDNLVYFRNNYEHSIDLVTGDGGFDFSINYELQEETIWKLLFSQLLYAITIQKDGGVFILKCFDIFHDYTLDLIYLCTFLYNKVSIYKPKTSRYANSEKYIICKDFQQHKVSPLLLDTLYEVFKISNYTNSPFKFLNVDFSYLFLNKISEINAIYGQQQIENIYLTLNMIKEPKHDKNKKRVQLIIKNNLNYCIEWCKIHNHKFRNVYDIDKLSYLFMNHLYNSNYTNK